MKKRQLDCKFISFLIALTLVLNWQNVLISYQVAFQQDNIDSWSVFMVVIGSLFLALNVMAVIGMFFVKRWGFVATYMAVIFSSVFFSTSYASFISKLLPLEAKTVSLIVTNSLVIIYAIYLNVLLRKK